VRADLVEKIGIRESSGHFTIKTWNLPVYPDYSWKAKDSRIWILTNANVNSATLLFLSFIRRNTDAVVIGERSSEPVNFGITNTFYTMPNTGLLFCLSKILVINGAEGEHIEPDLVIEQSFEEEINWYLGNGDATLQKAIDTITGRN
jgi:C-terminal processing protease CtpA/Prc